VNEQLGRLMKKNPENMLIFIRYWPNHQFQDEWVYNSADIDHASVIWAHDLGSQENQKLINYYPNRKTWLLEADGDSPALMPYKMGSQIAISSKVQPPGSRDIDGVITN
jgi:hypothetical protein